MRLITGGPAILVTVAGLLCSGEAAAAETGAVTLGCPIPQRIVFSGGAYTALESMPRWEGQWRSASASQGRVVRFESALVHRDNGTGEVKLAACTYETDTGQLIDMAYFSSSAPGRLGNLVVRLAALHYWQAEPGGFLECVASEDACRMVPLRFETLRTLQAP